MNMTRTISTAAIAIGVALAGSPSYSLAKDGGNRGNSGGGHESRGDSGKNSSVDRGRDNSASKAQERRSSKALQRESASVKSSKSDVSYKAGLNSLNRNYHAYLNSNDPRFQELFSYVREYAEYELKYGEGSIPTDEDLSDQALRDALAKAAGTETISDETLSWAKYVLGVGPRAGKIDEVRRHLAVRG
ncbi:hypothetical protein ASG68_27900 [Rhizobium sp. Leaf453]|nr:hypothetical protein ASG50_15735 [Rhizobium sp. Leaf386]KQT05082.1 hypothetical protein ASG42_21385 [Rhizobium sp. Leaf391]KQU02069.1 hypothetical protein ASG68_27900 [Rhizobium sp. Leaf453]